MIIIYLLQLLITLPLNRLILIMTIIMPRTTIKQLDDKQTITITTAEFVPAYIVSHAL